MGGQTNRLRARIREPEESRERSSRRLYPPKQACTCPGVRPSLHCLRAGCHQELKTAAMRCNALRGYRPPAARSSTPGQQMVLAPQSKHHSVATTPQSPPDCRSSQAPSGPASRRQPTAHAVKWMPFFSCPALPLTSWTLLLPSTASPSSDVSMLLFNHFLFPALLLPEPFPTAHQNRFFADAPFCGPLGRIAATITYYLRMLPRLLAHSLFVVAVQYSPIQTERKNRCLGGEQNRKSNSSTIVRIP